MSVSFKLFPEACLERIIERAIEEGKLFELLFTEQGRRLWRGWSEEQVRKMILKKLGIKSKRRWVYGGA